MAFVNHRYRGFVGNLDHLVQTEEQFARDGTVGDIMIATRGTPLLPRRDVIELEEQTVAAYVLAMNVAEQGGRSPTLMQTTYYSPRESVVGTLPWSADYANRISALRRGLDPVLAAGALRFAARGLRLIALEGRTAPQASWTGIRDEVRSLARHALAHSRARPESERAEVGLILHFIKRATWKAGGVERLELDPRGTGFRCGKWSTERAKEAMAIEAALDHHPELLLVLRGLDVANRELAIPTFCLVPLFEQARRASHRAAARLEVARPRWQVSPLRATCHAGEDYRRLLQGVRRVHELVEFELLQSGDRLGHGLALGHDPGRWAHAGRITVQSREERLDDLVWLLDRFGRGQIATSGSNIERTRVEDAGARVSGPAGSAGSCPSSACAPCVCRSPRHRTTLALYDDPDPSRQAQPPAASRGGSRRSSSAWRLRYATRPSASRDNHDSATGARAA